MCGVGTDGEIQALLLELWESLCSHYLIKQPLPLSSFQSHYGVQGGVQGRIAVIDPRVRHSGMVTKPYLKKDANLCSSEREREGRVKPFFILPSPGGEGSGSHSLISLALDQRNTTYCLVVFSGLLPCSSCRVRLTTVSASFRPGESPGNKARTVYV